MKIDIDKQIAEVARELALRRNVYPHHVARGKMDQAEADEHFGRMEAVMETLKWVRENREGFMDWLADRALPRVAG